LGKKLIHLIIKKSEEKIIFDGGELKKKVERHR
jgi:hypothetical protein